MTDTPGLFDTQRTHDAIIALLASQIFEQTSPGPHAILIVTSVDRITTHEKETIELIQSIFGDGALRYCIFIFTHEDKLGRQSIREWVNRSDSLRKVMEPYGNRYLSMNNLNVTKGKIQELMAIIRTVLEANKNQYYTNANYQRVEKQRALAREQKEEEEKEAKRKEVRGESLKRLYELMDVFSLEGTTSSARDKRSTRQGMFFVSV